MLSKRAKTPDRLKARALAIVEQVIGRHRACDFWRLRALYCPSKVGR